MSNNIDLLVGYNLARMRIAAGLTQKEFGDRCNPVVGIGQVSKYERGSSKMSSDKTIDFATVLGCRVADLFDGVDQLLPASDAISKGDLALVQNYKNLPTNLQDSVRVLVSAMTKELAIKLGGTDAES